MNELLIIWILSVFVALATIIITPIAYIIYKFNGGKENFLKWILYEV